MTSDLHTSRSIQFKLPVYETRLNGSFHCMACDAVIGRTQAALTWHEHTPGHAIKLMEWAFKPAPKGTVK